MRLLTRNTLHRKRRYSGSRRGLTKTVVLEALFWLFLAVLVSSRFWADLLEEVMVNRWAFNLRRLLEQRYYDVVLGVMTALLPMAVGLVRGRLPLDLAFARSRAGRGKAPAGRLLPDEVPPEIEASLRQFRRDHPETAKTAFIMVEFGSTGADQAISNAIKSELREHGALGLCADDKQYHDDLLSNVLTYVYGCGFGVAVFQRTEAGYFNPNVALEVGYMFALGRPVCILKDRTLRELQADLVGRLFKEFEPQDPAGTIRPQLRRWLHDKGMLGSATA